MKNMYAMITLGVLSTVLSSPVTVYKRDDVSVPDKIPAPGDGNCAVIGIAGIQTAIGIAKKRQYVSVGLRGTGPWVGVIDGDKKWIVSPEEIEDEKSGSGFKTTLTWDDNTLEWTAAYIGFDEEDWNANYSYNGKEYTCDGHKCHHYDKVAPTMGKTYHVGTFSC